MEVRINITADPGLSERKPVRFEATGIFLKLCLWGWRCYYNLLNVKCENLPQHYATTEILKTCFTVASSNNLEVKDRRKWLQRGILRSIQKVINCGVSIHDRAFSTGSGPSLPGLPL